MYLKLYVASYCSLNVVIQVSIPNTFGNLNLGKLVDMML